MARPQPQQVHRLRPVPAMIFAARWLQLPLIHLTFLVSAIATAAADRVLGIRIHQQNHAEAEAQ